MWYICYNFLTIDALLLTKVHGLHYSGSFIVLYSLMSFGKYMSGVHHYGIMNSSFTVLNFPGLHLFILLPPPRKPLATTGLLTVSTVLPFPEWHTVGVIVTI